MEVNLIPLGECCKFVSGSTLPSGEEYRSQPEGYLILKVSDLNLPENQRTVSISNEWIADAPKGSMVCSANSIVLPKRGGAISTNKKRLLLRHAILDPNLMGITPQSSRLDPEYLYFWFQQFDLTSITSGTAVPQLNKQDLDPLRIPLPPLPEQQRIASLLRRADRLRQLRRTAHDLGDSLLQSVFLEMFGDVARNEKSWDIATLEELGTDFIYGTSQKCFDEPNGFPVLRIPNVLHGTIDLTDLKYAEVSDKEVRNILLKDGDILFVRTNGNPDYVGRCAVFNLSDDFLFASYLIRARLDLVRINPMYLLTFLQSSKGREAMFPYIRTTAGQSNIGIEGLGQIPVPLPPLSLQEKFAGVVRLVESLRGRMSESERQVDGLFESLLSEAFHE